MKYLAQMVILTFGCSTIAYAGNAAAPSLGMAQPPASALIENQFSKQDDQWETFTNTFGHYEIKKPKCWIVSGEDGDDPKNSGGVLMNSASACKTHPSPLIEVNIFTPNTELYKLDRLPTGDLKPNGNYLVVRYSKLGGMKSITEIQLKDYEGKKAIAWEVTSLCKGRNLHINYFYAADESTIKVLERDRTTTLPAVFQKTLDSFKCL